MNIGAHRPSAAATLRGAGCDPGRQPPLLMTAKPGANSTATTVDENGDLVAEPPKDKASGRTRTRWSCLHAPSRTRRFIKTCSRVSPTTCRLHAEESRLSTVQSNAQIEAMRSGRLHVAGLASGETGLR